MTLPLDEWAILAAFSQPDNDGAFKGALADYLHGLATRKPVVLFAFAPKAAGTFLRSAAIVAIGGQLRRIVHAQGGRDAQLYLPILIAYYSNMFGEAPLVGHVHMQALPANRRFMEVLDLKPVIMLRSIPDMLASYWDMLETDPQARLDGINCTIPPMFPSMSRSDKADFLIEVVGPWYAGYFATWLEYLQQAPERVLLLRYDEFARAPAETLSRVLVHAGTAKPMERCQRAIDEIWIERNAHRFNRGETRRGREYFSWRHIDRLARMLSYYPIAQDIQTELLV